MFPAIVLVQADIDLHKRTPFRAFGLANQMQSGFLRRAIGLLRVAFNAGANDVFPRRRAAAVAGDDVVEIQIFPLKMFAAVLAGVFVALKNVVARELHFFLRQPVVNRQQNNSRHTDAEGNGMNRFLMRRVLREIAPLVEIKRAERAVFSTDDDVSLSLKKQCESAPGGADIYGLPEPVQYKNMLI